MDTLVQVIAAYQNQPTNRLVSDAIIVTGDEGLVALRKSRVVFHEALRA
jgi:hypothetical protein